MTYEKETLKQLRLSLDQEEDETSIIPILESHHKYLKDYASVLMDKSTPYKDKQAKAVLFFTILNMHTNAEEEILYNLLKQSTEKLIRMEGLRGQDEHELIYEIISELKAIGAETSWSEEIDAKMHVLAGLVKNHIALEEQRVFQAITKFIPESTLMDLTDDYLEKCKIYLDLSMADTTLEVSRIDVIEFTYQKQDYQ